MKKLDTIIRETGITYYQIAKELNSNPRNTSGYVKRQIQGIESMPIERLRKILNIVSKLSGKIFCEDDVLFWIERIKVK